MAEKEEFILKYMESEVGLRLGVMLNRKMGIRPGSSERSWGSTAHTDPATCAPWRNHAEGAVTVRRKPVQGRFSSNRKHPTPAATTKQGCVMRTARNPNGQAGTLSGWDE